MSENETRIVDVDGDELLVTWGWKGGMDGVAMIQTRAAHGEVVLDLSGIAKLREALDRAEQAYKARRAVPIVEPGAFVGDRKFTIANVPFASTPREAYAMAGAGNEFVAMAERMGAFNTPITVPGIAVKLFQHREEPIDPHVLAEAEKLVRAGYVFHERLPNRIECTRDSTEPTYMLTQEQSRAFWAALVKVQREAVDGKAVRHVVPRYPQLTDWVHAQPEGAVLLAVIHGSERAQPVAEDWILRRKLFSCNRCDLANAFVAGVKFDAVWLSREVAPDCESRIPQGVSVYREGT